MSTLKATNLQHASSSTANLTLASDGSVSGGLPTAGRNLLYNSAMQVNQRGTSATGKSATGIYTADRWQLQLSSLGTWDVLTDTTGPSGTGLTNSLKVTVASGGADASPAASDYAAICYRAEGQDLQRIKKGTSSAEQLTLSFWVKTSTTGTFVVTLEDYDNSRTVSKSYTVSAANTWEKKSITFPADTTGAFDNDYALSLQMYMWIGAGSNFTSGTLNQSWATTNWTNGSGASGQVNVGATAGNYWQVTGVQLEVGPVATAFEFKSYGQELRECQRYYYRTGGENTYQNLATGKASSTILAQMITPFPVEMRTAPTSIDVATLSLYRMETGATAVDTPTSISLNSFCSGANAGGVDVARGSGFTTGEYYWLMALNSTGCYLGFSAEL